MVSLFHSLRHGSTESDGTMNTPPHPMSGSTAPDDVPALEAELLVYTGPDRVVSSEEYTAWALASPRRSVIVRSHLPRLDAAVGNFQGGELIAISGLTKHGKSTFAKTLTRNFLREGTKTVWFSYEMPAQQFIETCRETMPFYLPLQLVSRSLRWILRRCIEAKLKYGVDVVMIDHLHYLVDLVVLRNPSLEIGGIIRQLKTMATTHNLIVFLIAHTTKALAGDEPTEADMRDSSFIAQEADTTLMVTRCKDRATQRYGNRAWLSVRNHRRTGVMGLRIPLVHINGWLEEDAHDDSGRVVDGGGAL